MRGIDLELGSGEFMAVLGPNGAGKTTLLKVLSLLVKPTRGQVVINGVNAGENPLRLRRDIGVVSHNTFLYGNLTAYENLLFYGRLYDVTNLRERIHQVIREVGLQYALADPVRTFSRGMQQRLAIARAILHDPTVLFLDEPYTGLDQHAMEILNDVLKGLRNQRRTIFLITHNFDQGLELSDQVIIMVKGRLAYHARTADINVRDFKRIYLQHVEGA